MPARSTEAFTPTAVYLSGEAGRLGSVTLDATKFVADADGYKIVQPGLVLASAGGYGASDLWGPYESGASDGRQNSTDNVLILHDRIAMKDSTAAAVNKEAAVLLEGTVIGTKVLLQDGSAIGSLLKDKLRSKLCNVTFGIE